MVVTYFSQPLDKNTFSLHQKEFVGARGCLRLAIRCFCRAFPCPLLNSSATQWLVLNAPFWLNYMLNSLHPVLVIVSWSMLGLPAIVSSAGACLWFVFSVALVGGGHWNNTKLIVSSKWHVWCVKLFIKYFALMYKIEYDHLGNWTNMAQRDFVRSKHVIA
jgi:hypothetical protein